MDLDATESGGRRDRSLTLIHDPRVGPVVILEPVTLKPVGAFDEHDPSSGPHDLLDLIQLDLIGMEGAILHLDLYIAPCNRDPLAFPALELIRLHANRRSQFFDPVEQISGSCFLG